MSESTPAPESNTFSKLLDELKMGYHRLFQGDFQQVEATGAERAELAAAKYPVTEAVSQNYAAWRKSILVVAAALLVVSALFSIAKFQDVEDQLVELHLAQSPDATQEQAQQAVRGLFGVNNLETLGYLSLLEVAIILLTTTFTILAAIRWSSVRRSRRHARRAWYVWILLPIAMAMIPWSGLLDLGHLAPDQAQGLKSVLGITLGLFMTILLGPRILALFPGAIRSALLIKTLVPETSLPAWVAALCAPIYMLVLVLVVALINQTNGNALLLFGTLFLMLAPLSYLRYIRSLLRPLDGPTAADRVRKARSLGYVLNTIGALLMLIFVIDLEMFSWDTALQLVITALGGLLLVMVVSSDLMLGMLRVSYEQASALHGTDMGRALQEKLDALTKGGLTEVRTPAEADESTPTDSG